MLDQDLIYCDDDDGVLLAKKPLFAVSVLVKSTKQQQQQEEKPNLGMNSIHLKKQPDLVVVVVVFVFWFLCHRLNIKMYNQPIWM